MDGRTILSSIPGGFPPRNSKLPSRAWEQAASLYVANDGRVTLRALAAECAVSHRTAWRMRALLRDTEAFLKDRRDLDKSSRAWPNPPPPHAGENP